MQTETITEDLYTQIEAHALTGSHTRTAVSLLTPGLNLTELPRDASYLVIENAHDITVIRLDTEGRPVAILERD